MHKKSLKKHFRGSRKLLPAHEKVCDENETKKEKKRRACGQEGVYKIRAESSCNGYQTTSAQRFLIH